MEAEQSRTRSEAEHKKTAANYNSCISHMRQLEKKLKRSINKSRSASPSSPCSPLLLWVAQARWFAKEGPLMSFDAIQMFHGMVA